MFADVRQPRTTRQISGKSAASVAMEGIGLAVQLFGDRALARAGDRIGTGEFLELGRELVQLLAAGHHVEDFFARHVDFLEGAVGAAAVFAWLQRHLVRGLALAAVKWRPSPL